MKTYLYNRVSSVRQNRLGKDGLTRQKESDDVVEFIQANNLDVVKTMQHIGSSFTGKNFDNDTILGKFIEAVNEGTISTPVCLCFENWDRFGRDIEWKNTKRFLDLISIGVSIGVVSMNIIIDQKVLAENSNILQLVVNDIQRARKESQRKSEFSRRNFKKKIDAIKKGEVIRNCNIPKYYDYVHITETHGKYILNDKADLVKEMILGIQAGKSMYSMADSFNTRNIKTFRLGAIWTGKAIRQILRNPILTGEYLGNKDYVPPLVDNDTFKTIQNILDANKTNRGTRGNIINIFKGLCYCSDCGRVMSFQCRKSPFADTFMASPWRYLRCSVQGKNGGCNNRDYIRITDFEREFFTEFLMKNPTSLVNDSDSAELKQLQKDIATKTAELSKVGVEITKVFAMTEGLDVPEGKARLAMLTEQRDSIKSELDKLTAKVSSVQDTPDSFDHIRYTVLGDLAKNYNINGYHIHHATEQSKNTKRIWAKSQEAIEAMQKVELDKRVETSLNDSYVREGLRVLIPTLVNKIIVDTKQRKFFVYNRLGKLVYESKQQARMTNASDTWKAGVARWDTRKMKDGRIIKINRKQKP